MTQNLFSENQTRKKNKINASYIAFNFNVCSARHTLFEVSVKEFFLLTFKDHFHLVTLHCLQTECGGKMQIHKCATLSCQLLTANISCFSLPLLIWILQGICHSATERSGPLYMYTVAIEISNTLYVKRFGFPQKFETYHLPPY